MKQVRNILAGIFWGLLGISVLLAVLFECEVLPMGTLTVTVTGTETSTAATVEFLCRFTMEVVTLLGIWLSLRLFKFQRVHADLMARKEEALKKWGVLRLLLLEVPMLLNTILYYMYMQTTYGYMAIIAVLCLPFVFPTLSRCEGEVEEITETTMETTTETEKEDEEV